MSEKNSNAKTAWNELISKISLGGSSMPKDNPTTQAAASDAAPVDQAVMENDIPGEKMGFSFSDLMPPLEKKERTTIIGESVEITGDVKVKGDVEIYGTIIGDVEVDGKISAFGKITGNVSGSGTVQMSSAQIQGNVTVGGTIELDKDSILTSGKLIARNIISDGKTICDMQIEEIARFQKNAQVTGEVRTWKISIEEGASIKGAIKSE